MLRYGDYWYFNIGGKNILSADMPRVLRIINRLNLGGPTYNVAYLTKYLAPEFETLLVSGMIDESEASSEFIIEKLGIEPRYISEMYRELNPLKDRAAYDKIRSIIREFKPDIVHTHAAKAGAVGRLAAHHEKVPVVLHTFHGHVFHSYFSPLKTRVFLEIERYLAKRSTGIIAISDIQKKELAEEFKIAPAGKFKVINLGFDLDRFAENTAEKRSAFRKRWGIEDHEIAIGIIGRLVPVKNHQLFLDGVKQLLAQSQKPLKIFIIGDGEQAEQVKAYASSLEIPYDTPESKVFKSPLVFTSWIKEVDIACAGLDLICLTSNNEGTPVSLIEAQAAGKAIVTTDTGGIRDIVRVGESALISAPRDVQGFANNLIRLVENDEEREAFSRKGRDFVFKQFSYHRLVDDMASYYRQLLTKH